VIERQLAHLPVRSISESALGKAERRAPQSRHTLEIASALFVVDVDAFPARDDERSFLLQCPKISRGVKVERLIAASAWRVQRHQDIPRRRMRPLQQKLLWVPPGAPTIATAVVD